MIFVLTTAWLCLISGNEMGVFGIERKTQSLGLSPDGLVGVRASIQAFAVAVVGGCPPLKSKTVKINCTHKIDKMSKGIDCTKKVPAGTKATFTCPNNTYMVEKYDSVTCGVPTKKKWSGKIVKCRSSDFTSTSMSTSSVETTASTDTIVSDLSSSGEETTIGGDTTSLSTDLTPSTVVSTSSSVESSTTTAAVIASNATTVATTNATTPITTATTTEKTLITNATTVLATTLLTTLTTPMIAIPSTTTTAPATTTTLSAANISRIGADTNISTTITEINTTTASSTTTTIASSTTTSVAPLTTTVAPLTTTTIAAATTVAPITTTTVTATTTSSATTLTTPTTTTTAVPPPGYENVPGVGIVKTSKEPKIFYDAKAECQLEGATLFVVNTTNKKDYMALFAAKPGVFLGAAINGYVWSGIEPNNGWKTPQGVSVKNIPLFKWGTGRPSATTICCAYVTFGVVHWDMSSCIKSSTKKQPYICEV